MQGQTSSYVITSLVTAPLSATLTTLANVHDELNIPTADVSNDSFLTRAITQESSAIARYCNRIFGLATWQDEFRPQQGIWGEGTREKTNPLVLTRWPLIASVINFIGNSYLNSTLVDGIASTAGLVAGQLVSGPGITVPGTKIQSVAANSITLTQPATSNNPVVGFGTGISVVELVAGIATGLNPVTAAALAAAGSAQPGTVLPSYDFELDGGAPQIADEGASRLYRLNEQRNPKNWPASTIIVVYQAGYGLPNDPSPTMPADLENACLRLVTTRFRARARDPMLMERNQPALGTERYWVGGTPGQDGAFAPEILALIEPYRVPVIA